jgi:hypothetical protein
MQVQTRRRSLSYAPQDDGTHRIPAVIDQPFVTGSDTGESSRKSTRQRYKSGAFLSGSRAGPGPSTLEYAQRKDDKGIKVKCSSNLSINIHSTDGFGGALTVTDISKIPWGRPGDIVEVRPARATTGRDGGPGQRSRGLGENTLPSKFADNSVRSKDRVKGNFLFKLRGNDEQQLRRLTAVSQLAAAFLQWNELTLKFRCCRPSPCLNKSPRSFRCPIVPRSSSPKSKRPKSKPTLSSSTLPAST